MDKFTILNLALIVSAFGIVATLVTRALARYPIIHRAIVRINLTRYSWLTGLLLVGLVPAAWLFAPALLWNLFVVNGADFFWVTLMAALTSATVILTTRVTLLNAVERFEDYQTQINMLDPATPKPGWSWNTWLVFWLLTIPVPSLALVAGWADRTDHWFPPDWWCDVGWIGAGIAAALFWLFVNVGLQWFLLGGSTVALSLLPFEGLFDNYRERSYQVIDRLTAMLATILKRFGPGYEHNGQLRPGHIQAILFGLIGLLTYVAIYYVCIWGGHRGGVWVPFPALGLVLLVIVLVGYALTAIAFALDYYRVPTLLTVALFSAGLYWINDTDHYFQLHPDRHAVASWMQIAVTTGIAATGFLTLIGLNRRWGYGIPILIAGCLALFGINWNWVSTPYFMAKFDRNTKAARLTRSEIPRFADVAQRWDIPHDKAGKKTLVIIAASGGGIQASAWTAKVLTGLRERYGADFAKSLKLMSSVSGGSLGTAAYIRGIKDNAPRSSKLRFSEINRFARASSLESCVWGIAFPDLLRFVFPPMSPQMKDRGWALEGAWRDGFRQLNSSAWNHDDGEWRLSHLMNSVKDDTIPIVVFNSVHAETGRRVLISPVLSESGQRPDDVALLAPPRVLEFWHLFDPQQADPRVATVVRLSATFPYVSPMSRADLRLDVDQIQAGGTLDPDRRLLQQGHFVDGGYVDNEGVLTVIEWLRTVMHLAADTDMNRRFDRVLIIRIIPFSPERKIQEQQAVKSIFRASGQIPTAKDDERPEKNIRSLPQTGWLNEFFGPIKALMALRGTSQNERNSLILDIFSKQYVPPDQLHAPGAKVYYVQFVFDPIDQSVAPPLSWKLNRRQDQLIDLAWTHLEELATDNNSPLNVVDGYFQPVADAKTLGPVGQKRGKP